MIWVILTVVCYSISSLGDKYISAKLKFSPSEFTFIVSLATAVWLIAITPFTGWQFELNYKNLLILFLLIMWKLIEFFSSAMLLKTVSAYELKAWLGINIIFSYISNVYSGNNDFNVLILMFSIILLSGIGIIVFDVDKTNIKAAILLSIVFILSKFFYGFHIGIIARECKSTSVLLIIMIIITIIIAPTINIKELYRKKGMTAAAITKLPNALGLA